MNDAAVEHFAQLRDQWAAEAERRFRSDGQPGLTLAIAERERYARLVRQWSTAPASG